MDHLLDWWVVGTVALPHSLNIIAVYCVILHLCCQPLEKAIWQSLFGRQRVVGQELTHIHRRSIELEDYWNESII